MERQRKLLAALAGKLSQTAGDKDLVACCKAAVQLMKYTTTDMTVDEAYDLGSMIPDVDLAGIETRTAAGATGSVGGMSVYKLDLPQIQRDIAELQVMVAERSRVAPERVAFVEVLNGSEVPQLAARTADYLEQRGFRVAKVDNAQSRSYSVSTVLYKPSGEQTADKVATTLEIPRESVSEADALSESDADVQVILGKTFDVPRTGPSAPSRARPQARPGSDTHR